MSTAFLKSLDSIFPRYYQPLTSQPLRLNKFVLVNKEGNSLCKQKVVQQESILMNCSFSQQIDSLNDQDQTYMINVTSPDVKKSMISEVNQSWKIDIEKEIMNEQDENQLKELLQLKQVKNLNQSYELSEQPSFYSSNKNLQNFFQTPQTYSLKQKFFQDNSISSNAILSNSFQKHSTKSLFKEELDALKTQSIDICDPSQLLQQVSDCIDSQLLADYLECRQHFIEAHRDLLTHHPKFTIIFIEEQGFYEGELNNDQFHGIGGRIFPNSDIYFGQWQNGEIQGQGVYKFNENALYNTYYGSFEKGVSTGIGLYQLSDGRTYEGTTKNLELTGIGKLINQDGSFYRGELLNGIYHGVGYEMLRDGTQYEGDYVNGCRHGKGKLTSKVNQIMTLFNGEFREGKIEGNGVMIWPNGNCYDGQWKNSIMHGQGKYAWANGQIYIGGYVNGIKSGYGLIYQFCQLILGEIQFPNGKKFKGEFKNGQVHGQGVFIQKKGAMERHYWENGVMKRTSTQLYKEI